MGVVNVNQVATYNEAFQEKVGLRGLQKGLKELNNSTRILKSTQSLRGVGATTAKASPQSMAPVKEEAKQDSGSYVTSEIPSHLLGNSRPKQRVNCSITGSCLAAPLSMLVVI